MLSTVVGSGGIVAFAVCLVAVSFVGTTLILSAWRDDIEFDLSLGRFHLRVVHPRRRRDRR